MTIAAAAPPHSNSDCAMKGTSGTGSDWGWSEAGRMKNASARRTTARRSRSTALVQCDDQQNQDEQTDDDRSRRNGHTPLTTCKGVVGRSGLRGNVCDFGGIHRRNGAFRVTDVDAVFPGNGSHVSALKKQPDGLAVPVGGTRLFLNCGVEDRLTRNMCRRRGLVASWRRGLDLWGCHQNGKNHCYKRTHRAHRPSSCRGAILTERSISFSAHCGD